MTYQSRIKEYRTVAAADIQRNPLNFRRHPEHQRTALRGLLASVGRVAPILAYEQDGQLVCLDGHARLEESDTWDVAILDIDEQEAATVLAMLDKIGADAEIDPDALMALLDSLPSDARQTAGAAWSDDELAALIGEPEIAPGAGGDEFDPTPEEGETRTALGELWIIGGVHRLLVGDCTIAANVARLMGDYAVDTCISDPPYGMKWSADASRFSGGKFGSEPRGREREDVIGDDEPFDPTPFLGYKIVVLWGMNHFCSHLPAGGVLVWIKKPEDRFGTFLSDCELAWTNKGHGVYAINHEWGGITRESERGEYLHPTQKPVEVMKWVVEKVEAGAIIYDPFLGSGTTLIAAHRTGRRCFGCEIAPRYADVILRRAEVEGLTVERAAT